MMLLCSWKPSSPSARIYPSLLLSFVRFHSSFVGLQVTFTPCLSSFPCNNMLHILISETLRCLKDFCSDASNASFFLIRFEIHLPPWTHLILSALTELLVTYFAPSHDIFSFHWRQDLVYLILYYNQIASTRENLNICYICERINTGLNRVESGTTIWRFRS